MTFISIPLQDTLMIYYNQMINNDTYNDQMVDRIHPTDRLLNKSSSSNTEAHFLGLNLCIFNDTVPTKIYDKRDDFDIVKFLFLDGDVSRRTSYWVYISRLIRFARASSNLSDFNCRNKVLTAKLFRQGYPTVILNFAGRFRNFIADTVLW